MDLEGEIASVTAEMNRFSASQTGINGVTTAFKNLGSVIVSVLSSPITWVIAGITAAALAFDHFHVSAKEANEEMDNAFTDYADTKSDLEAVNNELETTKSRIAELESKGKLTFIEQSELENLRAATAELELQSDLADKRSLSDGKKLASKTVDAYEKNYGKYTTSQDKINQYNNTASLTGNAVGLFGDEKNISAIFAGIEQNKKLLDDAIKNEDTKAIKTLTDENEHAENLIWEQVDALQGYKEKLDSIPFSELTENQKKTRNEIQDDIEFVYKKLDSSKWKDMQFNKIFSTDKIKNVKKDLIDMSISAGKAGISVSQLKAKYPELTTEIQKSGLSIEEFVNELNAQAMTGADGSPLSELELLESQMASFEEKSVSMINNIDSINAALANGISGKGLTVDYDTETRMLTGDLANVSAAFKDLEGYDPAILFEKTANGVHLNRQALHLLEAQQEAITKEGFLEKQRDLNQKLQAATLNLQQAQKSGSTNEVSDQQAIISTLQGQLETVAQLSAAYDGATSAYQKWLTAQSGGEEGDMFRTVSETMKERGAELYKEGRYNTEEFRAIANYFSYEDLSTAPMEDLVLAYEAAANARDAYFTGNKDGIDNFINDMERLSNEEGFNWVTTTEEGFLQLNTGADEEIAQRFNLSKDAVQALLRAASEYTDTIRLGDTSKDTDRATASLQKMQDGLDNAQAKLQALNVQGTDFKFDFNINTSDVNDINTQISTALATLDHFKDSNGKIDLSLDGAQEAVDIIEILLQKKHELDTPAVMTIDSSGLDMGSANAVYMVQQYQLAIEELNYLLEKQDIGIPVDDSQITTAQSKVDTLFSEIKELSKNGIIQLSADVTLDATTPERLNSDLNKMTPEIAAKVKPELPQYADFNNITSIMEFPFHIATDDLNNEISQAKAALGSFKDESGQVDLSIPGASEVYNTLDTLIKKKQEINHPTILDVDTSTMDKATADTLEKLKSYQNLTNEFRRLSELKNAGIPIDSEQLSSTQDKITKLYGDLQKLSKDGSIKIGEIEISTESVEQFQSDLSKITSKEFAKLDPNFVNMDGVSNPFDVATVGASNLSTQIEEAQKKLDRFTGADGKVNLEVDGAAQAVETFTSLIQEKNEASRPAVMTMDTTGFDVRSNNIIGKLREYRIATEELATLNAQKEAGIPVDTEKLTEAQNKITELYNYLQTISSNGSLQIGADLKVNTESLETLNADLYQLHPEVKVKVKADENEFDSIGSEFDLSLKISQNNLVGQLAEAKSALDQFKDSSGNVDLKINGAAEAVKTVQTLIQARDELKVPAIMTIDTSGFDMATTAAVNLLQQYQSASDELKNLNEQKSVGIPVDDTELQGAQEKVSNLLSSIQAISKDGSIQLGANVAINTESLGQLNSSLASLTPSITVSLNPDASKVTADVKKPLDTDVNYNKASQEDPVAREADLSYNCVYQEPPKDKTARLSYITSGFPLMLGGTQASGTMLSPALASGTAFNVLNTTPAYANGKVGLEQDQTALTNELGQESLIRDGVWSLLPGGMHLENLKKGDIILNKSQTSALLAHGKAAGVGRAYADGTLSNVRADAMSHISSAFSSGSWVYGNTGNGNMGGTGTTYHPSTPEPKASNNDNHYNDDYDDDNDVAEAVEEAKDEFKEFFDHIEILLARMDSTFNRLKDSIETFSYNLVQQNQTADEAIAYAQGNIGILQQAYNRYMAQADNSGLEENWRNVVNSGEIEVSTITDEDLKGRIDDYKEWYEKALSTQEKIADLQKEILSLAVQKLENIQTYFNNQFDFNDNFGYFNQTNQIQKALDDYTKELENQVNNGIIKKFSNEWYQAQTEIASYMDKVFDSILKKYDVLIDHMSSRNDKLDNKSKLMEARDQPVDQSIYKEQINNTNTIIDEQMKKRQDLLNKQAVYDAGSEKYNELADQIASVDNEVFGLLTNIEELKDKIWEVRWQPFFDAQEDMEYLIKETDDLRTLLNDDAFINPKTGALTSDGLANIALLSQSMNVAKQQIRDYQAAIKKLDEDLKNGNITTAEYKEQQRSFLDAIRDSAGTVEDYRNEIIDLWKTQLEAENDVIQGNIDKHKELLQAKKDNNDFTKNIQSQTKDINAIKAQMAALSGVNNEAAKAELKRLQAQLSEAEDSLQETRDDREYEVRNKGYDTLSNNLNDALQDTIDEVTLNANKQEEVISNMLNNVVNNYADAYNKIQSIIDRTGFTSSGELGSNIGNLGTQSGAQNQVNNSTTNAPNYKPSNSTNVNTGTIVDKGTQDKNNKVEDTVSKTPDIYNRPVAELKIDKTSLAIQEGQSGTLSTSIRPNDAANKRLSWTSSNPSVATAAEGTVRAVKPGSAQIIASTTDGSGLSVSCSVTVTPKPTPPPPPPASPQGNGRLDVGDRVSFDSGIYYNDSDGNGPFGRQHRGEQVYITYINPGSEYPIHIGTTPTPGYDSDLGWLRQDQVSGYRSGTKGATAGLHEFNEDGTEAIITNQGSFRYFGTKDNVFDATRTKRLWDLTDQTVVPAEWTARMFSGLRDVGAELGLSEFIKADRASGDVIINNELQIQGNVDRSVMPDMEAMLDESVKRTVKYLNREAKLRGGINRR